MKVREIVEALQLEILAGEAHLDNEVVGGYVADLLSCVMAGAEAGNIWVTLQTHANIVAVASLLGLAGIIVAEGAPVPPESLEKAEEQGVVVLASSSRVYETVAQLVALGI
ncbi:MAG: serine kinase [Anaerolineae bacterium]|nr:serine kinase [Anaerolineae bacterium]